MMIENQNLSTNKERKMKEQKIFEQCRKVLNEKRIKNEKSKKLVKQI